MAKANLEVLGHELTVQLKYQPTCDQKKCFCGQGHKGFLYQAQFLSFVENGVDVTDKKVIQAAMKKLKGVLRLGSGISAECLEPHINDVQGRDGVHFEWGGELG